jgi:hypothetical protein
MIISDTPNCGITYNRHYDDRNSFIIQATGESVFEKFNFFSFFPETSSNNDLMTKELLNDPEALTIKLYSCVILS